jgi:hypothetical protein
MSSAQDVVDWFRAQGREVLSFVGYSGAGYEDPAALRAAIARVLDGCDAARTLVNAGATGAGIGAVYALARERGFATTGICSSLALEAREPVSPQVQQVYWVDDALWGGVDPATGRLSPTSQAMVDASDRIVAIGGGEIARDECLAARAAGTPVLFIAADADHAAARRKAAERGDPPPTDFRGAAHAALGDTP